MYIQIRCFKVQSGDARELCQQAGQALGPAMERIQGFVDYKTVANDDGTVMSIGAFQDKAGAQESQRLAHEWTQKNAIQQIGEPQVIEGDVVYDAAEAMRPSMRAA